MTQTLEIAPEAVAHATSQVERLSAYLARLLSFIPDDRLTWAPSETSRSALRLVAHCAAVNTFFSRILTSAMPDPMPTPEAFFGELHATEKGEITREETLTRLESTTAELRQALGTVTDATIDATRSSPFGAFPAQFWVDQCVEHLAYHSGQLAYLQTIWGDLDNHLG